MTRTDYDGIEIGHGVGTQAWSLGGEGSAGRQHIPIIGGAHKRQLPLKRFSIRLMQRPLSSPATACQIPRCQSRIGIARGVELRRYWVRLRPHVCQTPIDFPRGFPMTAASPPSASVQSNYLAVREAWLNRRKEQILDPERPIIDPHHHLWDRHGWRYLLDDL